jgi:eukaryotic-like serine/threonine-protein kinase
VEHIEGQTLAERLSSGPLPVADVIRYATELADALDHAHRHGLVHRDVKPGNVMLTRAGAKLLDFGLSKSQSGGLPALSTISPGAVPLTAAGAMLGTFPYMAPEQLAGREADERSDIFALGAIIHEMTTGQRAFDGATAATVIGAVLHADPPPVSSLQPTTPPALDRIVSRCLAKDPENRWQSARDLALDLKWIAEQPQPAVSSRVRRNTRPLVIFAASLLAMLMTVAAGVVYWRSSPVPDVPVRLTFTTPAGVTLADLATAGPVTISPDGRRLAFIASASDGKRLLWVRSLDSTNPTPLPGTDGAAYPFWSPDSRRIGFFAGGNLKKINADGGPPQTICPAILPRGGTRSQDGVIVFSGNAGNQLYRTSDVGGVATPLAWHDANSERLWPSFLPDGRHVVYFARPEKPGIYIGSLDSPETSLVAPGYGGVAYVPGYLLLLQSGSPGGASQTVNLIAQPFDADRLQLTGHGMSIADQVEYRTLWARGGFSVSNTGTLVTASDTLRTEMAWFDRHGRRLETVRGIVPSASRRFPELSPDDTRLATTDEDPVVRTSDIHLFDLTSATDSRLTSDPALDSASRWSPDSRHIVFTSSRDNLPPNLFRTSAAGIRREERLTESKLIQQPNDWSRDGRFLLFAMLDPRTQWDIWRLPMSDSATGAGPPEPLLRGSLNECNAQLSPDGHWMAYQSDESGVWEIYLRDLSGPTDRRGKQLSSDGGVWPVWRRDGRELFYIAADGTLMAVPIRPGRELEAGAPLSLFKTKVAEQWNYIRNYTLASDGQRFLINTRLDEASDPPTTVTLHWPATIRR